VDLDSVKTKCDATGIFIVYLHHLFCSMVIGGRGGGGRWREGEGVAVT